MADAVDIASIRPPPEEPGRGERAAQPTTEADRRKLVDSLAERIIEENSEMMRELAR